MNSILKQLLEELNIHPDYLPPPGGSYVSVNVRAKVAYVAIQFPILNNKHLYQGRLGEELITKQGYEAAKLCVVNILSQVDHYVGLSKIVGLNHLDIYYQQAPGWDDGPLVANGGSDLFVKILGEKGRHTRSIFGVEHLPRNFCIGVNSSFTVE